MSAPSLRVYVHSVPSADYPAWPDVTWSVDVSVGDACPTLRKLKQAFKEELMRRTNMDKGVLRLPIMTAGVLRRADGRELGADDAKVTDVCGDRDDVFFELKPAPPAEPAAPSMKHKGGAEMAAKQAKQAGSAAPTAAAAGSAGAAGAAAPKLTITNSSTGQTYTMDRRDPLTPLNMSEQLLYQQLTNARDLQSKGQLRKARDVYVQVLATVPAEASKGSTAAAEHAASVRQICHQQLGVLHLYNRQWEAARTHLEAAVKIVTAGQSEANAAIVRNIGKTPQAELAQLTALTGQCYYGLSDFSEATTHFERALKLLQPKGDTTAADEQVKAAIKDTKVWLARALYRGTHAERAQALQLFEQLIAQDEHHAPALAYYAQVAIECGKKGEVIPYLLRALVAIQAAGAGQSKGAASYEASIVGAKKGGSGGSSEVDPQLVELVQTLLTDLVMMPDGVNMLFTELHAASNNHSALTFIAQTIKDQGGVSASIAIYKRALEVCGLDARGRASLLLNLVHTEELDYRYNEAFGRIRDYLVTNADMRVGALRVGDFAAAIAGIDDVYDVRLRTGTHPQVPAWTEIGPIFDEGTCHVTIPDPNAPPPPKSTAVPYPADELHVLALMFTAAKMLYVCGGLQVLPTLVNLLEPLRINRDLHFTLIRNEHAYYSSIAQMLRSVPFPLPLELAQAGVDDCIYVCGDSHCMSAAWQLVKLDCLSRPLLLVPRLVTGLKVWHMRPACRFYPKRNFEAAMRNIPSGAQVIFNFGEIDCREGILVAVEKGRYESVEQGVGLAVDVYIKALQEQVHYKSLRAYVHPLTPVLDVTRPTVKKFEACLRERLNLANAAARKAAGLPVRAAGTGVASKEELVSLDFFSQLLTPDGKGFNMAYHLDSTHLKPTYVGALLRPALNAVFVPRKGQALAAKAAMSTLDKINAMARGDFPEHDDEQDANSMD